MFWPQHHNSIYICFGSYSKRLFHQMISYELSHLSKLSFGIRYTQHKSHLAAAWPGPRAYKAYRKVIAHNLKASKEQIIDELNAIIKELGWEASGVRDCHHYFMHFFLYCSGVIPYRFLNALIKVLTSANPTCSDISDTLLSVNTSCWIAQESRIEVKNSLYVIPIRCLKVLEKCSFDIANFWHTSASDWIIMKFSRV